MKPLVSILIPAYNAEDTIAQTLQSAIAQTWPRKEIILVDDGSTDRTAEVAQRFGSNVTVVSSEHRGAQVARNHAFRLSQGEYIQWLDADDLLAPDKIERQLAALRESDGRRILLSSSWAFFYYRTRHARFVPTSLWQDLSPIEWLLKNMSENVWMANTTWLTSRELADAAGPWDTGIHHNQDGEYFARVLLASEGTRFVPGARVFYRAPTRNSTSYIGNSEKKVGTFLCTTKLQMKYIRSLEESERVRKACLAYLQHRYDFFYPERPNLLAELQCLASQFQGQLEEPRFAGKYALVKSVLGFKAARRAYGAVYELKRECFRSFDRAMYSLTGS